MLLQLTTYETTVVSQTLQKLNTFNWSDLKTTNIYTVNLSLPDAFIKDMSKQFSSKFHVGIHLYFMS